MPKSMNQQTIQLRKRSKRKSAESNSRKNALELLQQKQMNLRSISRATGVPKSTVSLMKKKLEEDDCESLRQMVHNPNKRGRRTVLTKEEEEMTKERIKVAAARGFAIDYCSIRSIMSRIAADGRNGGKNGIPSYDTVRAFRARHRDITCKKAESKDHVKLKAECFHHVESFFKAPDDVQSLHPGILSNPIFVWNMDETAVSAVEGNEVKVFSGVDTHHGGFRGASTPYGISRHVTAVVAVSAAGVKAPPFFIVAGKKLSSRWLEPVKGSFGKTPNGICSRFMQPNWFPPHGVIKLTDNGSMEMGVMSAFFKHLNNYVRQFCADKTYLLCLDGHSSRKGVEWIEECMSNNCEAVLSPANTSHFLQACDQNVNKRFKRAMGELRDEFCKFGSVDTTQVNFNLACGVYAFDSISASDIVTSFRVTGLHPFDRTFPLQFKSEKEKTERKAEDQWRRIKDAGPGSRLKTVITRRTDYETLAKVQRILLTNIEACRQIQQLSLVLKNAETTNNILISVGSGRNSDCSTTRSDNANTARATMLDGGAPAEWVTVGEVYQNRKEKQAEQKRLRIQKELEKARKESERNNRIERERLEQHRKAEEKKRKKLQVESQNREKKRQRVLGTLERERFLASKKAAAERSKENAKKLRADALDISKRAVSVWYTQNSQAKKRGRKRHMEDTGKVVPYARTFIFTASLVVEVVEAAMTIADHEDAVQKYPILKWFTQRQRVELKSG